MTKKIILVFLISFTIIACGKKGDPIYKESQKKTEARNLIKNMS